MTHTKGTRMHTQYLTNTQTQCHTVRETSQKGVRGGRGLINGQPQLG